MPHYQARGLLPQKRCTRFDGPSGAMTYEHYLSADGFDGPATMQYHLHPPTRITRIDAPPAPERTLWQDSLTQNLLFHVDRLDSGGDFLAARVEALVSDEMSFAIARPDRPMAGFYRNGTADEAVLIVEGEGTFESTCGRIDYGPLDVIHVPRGETVRWLPRMSAGKRHCYAVFESRSPLRVPPQFLKPNGQFRENASYHERDIRVPVLGDPIDERGDFPIAIKVGERIEVNVLDHHPFDVIGWDGCLYPWALNLRDYEPLSGRIALMPDQYALFVTDRSMVSAITPRRLADHPQAAPMQPFHQNLDFDEILYRFSGTTGSTGNQEPEPGTFTLHPRAGAHGPKAGFEHLPMRTHQDAWGLMVDTRSLLRPTLRAMPASDPGYGQTFLGPAPGR